MATEMPVAHDAEGALRLAKAEPFQARQCCWLGLARPEHEGRRRLARVPLEEQPVMPLHAGGMGEQGLLEGGEVRKAAEAREPLERLRVGGHALGLLVAQHLEPVLHRAQERVGLSQFVPRPRVDPARFAKPIQSLDGAAPAQGRLATAEDELLRLREELDLADAATTDLDVVARHRDLVMAAHGLDLALERVWISAMAAKSKWRRQMNGPSSLRKPDAAVSSPATGRALMKAARSQSCPIDW